ncbi:MAG TPA: methyltransferase domain-containing protein, partial [Mycobacterium sp.]
VTEAMLAAGVRPGDRVLELACGPGGTGLAAADVVGPDGEVVLSDVVLEMLGIAAQRAAARQLGNITIAQVDMENIAFPDASFDAVLCREGLMLVIDPAAALREAHRVLVPGGSAAFAVWGPRERNPWLSLLLDEVSARLGVPVPPPGMPDPFGLAEHGNLEELLGAAGFDDVVISEVATPMAVSTFDEWWSIVPALAGPVRPVLDAQPPEVIAAVQSQIEAAIGQFRSDAGGFEIPGLSFLACGQRRGHRI